MMRTFKESETSSDQRKPACRRQGSEPRPKAEHAVPIKTKSPSQK